MEARYELVLTSENLLSSFF